MGMRVMIIDAEADFRTLLHHHVTTHWHDAIVAEFDPVASGHLPDEFSGAGNDIVLLGNDQGNRNAIESLRRFVRTPGFPPVIYFGHEDAKERAAAKRYGVSGYLVREEISHSAFAVLLADIQHARSGIASTDSLFVGDFRTGIKPLIKGYAFVRKLAQNEYSAVYLAERESSKERVVLKVLHQVPDRTLSVGAFDRFLQEYEIIAGLDHPNVVKIHDLGVGDDHAHIAMEYLVGGDLRQRIANGVEENDAVSYLRQIAGALAKIHSVGVLHRDLKPGNIMFRDDDSVALIDFGLAKRMRLDDEITGSGEIFGTPYYMSPEQGHATDVDERSDIYSLGVIFFEMLTGDKPYRASNAMGIIYRHSNAPIPRLPAALSKHQPLLDKLLAKQPDDRLQTAAELEAWL